VEGKARHRFGRSYGFSAYGDWRVAAPRLPGRDPGRGGGCGAPADEGRGGTFAVFSSILPKLRAPQFPAALSSCPRRAELSSRCSLVDLNCIGFEQSNMVSFTDLT
jgi:hypothetical protein